MTKNELENLAIDYRQVRQDLDQIEAKNREEVN
jgi:hypothetical protein